MSNGFSLISPRTAVSNQVGPTDQWVPWFNGVSITLIRITQSGTTSERPIKNLWVGMPYFDTTLGQPIWIQSLNPTVWTTASGGGGGGGSIVSSLTITSNTPNAFLYSGPASEVLSTTTALNGEILIGKTGASPIKANITGAANRIIVTNGPGSINIQTPQDIGQTSNPVFGNLLITGSEQVNANFSIASNNINAFTYFNNLRQVKTTASATDGQLLIGRTGFVPVANTLTAGAGVGITNGAGSITVDNTGVLSITGTANQITVSASTGNVTLSIPSTFIAPGSIEVTSTLQVDSNTASSFTYSDATKKIVTTSVPLDGELLIGNTGGIPIKNTLTQGTGILIANAAGSITISADSSALVTTFSAGTTGFTPSSPTSGAIILAGTLNETHGGTNQSTYTTGDTLYASNTDVLSKLPIGSNGEVLTISAGLPSWVAPSSSGLIPYFIPSGNTFTIQLYQQALFTISIDNEGTIDNNGILVYVD